MTEHPDPLRHRQFRSARSPSWGSGRCAHVARAVGVDNSMCYKARQCGKLFAPVEDASGVSELVFDASVCQKMGQVYRDATAYILDHPKETVAILQKRFSNLEPALIEMSFQQNQKSTTGCSPMNV